MISFSKNATDELGPLELDITPLIDVVFLLLIFFMISTTFVDSSTLPIELPSAASTPEATKSETLEIRIAQDGTIEVAQQQLSIQQLRSRLTEVIGNDPSKTTALLLRADKESKHGTVVEVMDIAQQLGITSIAVAVQSGES